MWNNTNVKQLKTFWESGQTGTSIFTFFAAQNGLKMGLIVHICESSSNEHKKQEWWESKRNFLTKYSKTWIFPNFGGPPTKEPLMSL